MNERVDMLQVPFQTYKTYWKKMFNQVLVTADYFYEPKNVCGV